MPCAGFSDAIPFTGRRADVYKRQAVHLGCDGPLIPLKGDELPVPSGPVGPGPGEKANGLQQIGLSLGILSPDHIDPRVKGSGKVGVVAKLSLIHI